MRLIEELELRLKQEESPFRAQLLREDIARLDRLRGLARRGGDLIALRQASMRLGWTQGDMRTQELRAPLEALVDAIYACECGNGDAEQEARVIEAWNTLHQVRMERLTGCLSTPVPKPDEGA